jgi:diacylglycerol kinase family enzyme
VLAPDDDAGELAHAAVERGAETVGMAGGDGSLAPVAALAVEKDVPFVPIPFGTRNHFAGDVGFDVDDPIASLAAFQGPERRVDAASVSGRTFLNNVSLGLYASFVHDPARKTRNRLLAFARMAPAALGRARKPLAFSLEVNGRREEHSALIAMVSNNKYEMSSPAELGERPRLDEGVLHAYVIGAVGRWALLSLLAKAAVGNVQKAHGWVDHSAPRLEVEAEHPRVHAAVDGEPVVLQSPLTLEIQARALRVRTPG